MLRWLPHSQKSIVLSFHLTNVNRPVLYVISKLETSMWLIASPLIMWLSKWYPNQMIMRPLTNGWGRNKTTRNGKKSKSKYFKNIEKVNMYINRLDKIDVGQ
jgi:hypothetical protein